MFSIGSAQLDFLGHGDAVLGDGRRAELLVDDDVPALGAERDLHRLGQSVDAPLELGAGVGVEHQFLGSHVFCLLMSCDPLSRSWRGCRRP